MNLAFQPSLAHGKYQLVDQECLEIDGRLNPPRGVVSGRKSARDFLIRELREAGCCVRWS